MKWIVALQLTAGCLFVIRTLNQYTQLNICRKETLTKIGTAIISSLFLLTAGFLTAPCWHLCGVIGVCAMSAGLKKYFLRRLESRFHSEFPEIINQLILSMKTGLSFREACERLCRHPRNMTETWLRDSFETIVFLQHSSPGTSKQSAPVLRRTLADLKKISEHPHHSLSRLNALRYRIKILSDFRRKSGQATLQARIQLFVLSGLYLALLAGTIASFGWSSHSQLIMMSIAWYILGSFLFLKLTRRTKWSV